VASLGLGYAALFQPHGYAVLLLSRHQRRFEKRLATVGGMGSRREPATNTLPALSQNRQKMSIGGKTSVLVKKLPFRGYSFPKNTLNYRYFRDII